MKQLIELAGALWILSVLGVGGCLGLAASGCTADTGKFGIRFTGNELAFFAEEGETVPVRDGKLSWDFPSIEEWIRDTGKDDAAPPEDTGGGGEPTPDGG